MIEMISRKLSEIAEITMGQSPPSSAYNINSEGLPFFQGKAEFGSTHPTPRKWCSEPKKLAQENDILMSVRAPVGAINIADQKCCIGRGLAAISYDHVDYLYYFLLTQEHNLDKQGTGSTFKAINKTVLQNIEVPIPKDKTKQDHIVKRIKSLFKEIESGTEFLDKAKADLKIYKQSILNAAIRGNLIPQDPKDEPASVLLEKIKAEKEKLIAEKKIKRTKPLPLITAEEMPFELPKDWEWAYFSDIAEVKSNLVKPEDYKSHPHIAPDNIEKHTGRLLTFRTIAEDNVRSPKHLFFPKQILYSKIRPYLSKLVRINFEGLCSADMYPIEAYIDTDYLYYYMLSSTFLHYASNSGTRSVLPKINQKELGKILVPIPPLNEQKRIASAINETQQKVQNTRKIVSQQIRHSQTLKQAILKKAFEGKL